MAERSGGGQTDWGATLEALLEGDALALARLTRLINGFLGRWNAYDFRSDWEDLVQEVVVAAALALREGRIRDRRAVVGYLRTTARYKFIDRLKAHTRTREDETLPWEEVLAADEAKVAEDPGAGEMSRDLAQALERLPSKQRLAVVGVHVQGRTYDQVAEDTGIPLGSLKRYLRDGLSQLREDLSDFLDSG
ncbi:MAG: RNA polymerase sigma factor [Myxococcota bacterium]